MDTKEYDAVVIGSGHAGCEACLALARTGHKTMLLTLNLDSIAYLACNPSIGGTAKGHLVCEIDALGGEIGVNADKTLLQLRMLNMGKGPAVFSLRAQSDKVKYHERMKKVLETTPNLYIKQAEASEIVVEDGKVVAVKTAQGEIYKTKTVVVCTGVYLNSRILIGDFFEETGPNGFKPATRLTKNLIDLGFEIRRFKTGTPTRVNSRSIDYSVMEKQLGDENIQTFSFKTKKQPKNKSCCYLCYTNEQTHKIIRDNLHLSAMNNGLIEGVGPRYCPSIESKIVRFADKDRHQVFLEPEAYSTNEMYVQGLSTSLPVDVQEKFLKTIKGMENVEIMRDAYAIEYDCINALELTPDLQSKRITGLYFAGQINGTSGYEEAAAQGIIAGINAHLQLCGRPPLILKRSDAYIGVLIDDLVTKGTDEPYRMMTSRAEYRLKLRQDNADLRLTQIGRDVGLVDNVRYKNLLKKIDGINKAEKLLTKFISPALANKMLESVGEEPAKSGISFKELFKRTKVSYKNIKEYFEEFAEFDDAVLNQVEINCKYEGYLARQEIEIEKAKQNEKILLPADIDYFSLKGLKIEAQQKLNEIKPLNLGQASRISGVSPADIAVLSIYLKTLQNWCNAIKNVEIF